MKAMLALSMATALGCAAMLEPMPLERAREIIRPSDSELRFESIGWLPTFWEGVTQGQATNRPILLWAMNGHPLACT